MTDSRETSPPGSTDDVVVVQPAGLLDPGEVLRRASIEDLAPAGAPAGVPAGAPVGRS